MRRKAWLTFVVLASINCAGLTSFLPSPGTDAQVRQTAARVADGLAVAAVSLDAVGTTVDTLPIPVAAKDALDCGILRVVGHDAPSVTVLKVCGAIPSGRESPIGQALTALRTVSAQPGLCGIVRAVMDALLPLLSRLEGAGASMAVVRVSIGFTLRMAGGCQ
jgi:hypothetical protein